MERAKLLGKKIECIIGIIFLIPGIIGVLAFLISLVLNITEFSTLNFLSENWISHITIREYSDQYHEFRTQPFSPRVAAGAGAMSAAPIYLGLMSLAGVYLIKDSFKYLFIKAEKTEKAKRIEPTKKEEQ